MRVCFPPDPTIGYELRLLWTAVLIADLANAPQIPPRS
jgi:hypothetical protein